MVGCFRESVRNTPPNDETTVVPPRTRRNMETRKKNAAMERAADQISVPKEDIPK